jgi:hypothetical protein
LSRNKRKKQCSIYHLVAYKMLILNIWMFCMVWYIDLEIFRIWKNLVKTENSVKPKKSRYFPNRMSDCNKTYFQIQLDKIFISITFVKARL